MTVHKWANLAAGRAFDNSAHANDMRFLSITSAHANDPSMVASPWAVSLHGMSCVDVADLGAKWSLQQPFGAKIYADGPMVHAFAEPLDDVDGDGVADHALAWFKTECANLVAAVGQAYDVAYDAGEYDIAWKLPVAMSQRAARATSRCGSESVSSRRRPSWSTAWT
jgi:hypothetical protein